MIRNIVSIKKYYAFSFFVSLHFFSAVLVPFFTVWGGISKTQMLLLQSWFVMWIFLLEVPTGAVADYFGRKFSLSLGALVVTIAALIYGSTPDFKLFLLGEFLFAVAFALMSGADDALLYDALKESGREKESKRIFGRAHSFTLLGMLVSAPIGSVIAARFGVNFPMIFSAVPFFIASLIAFNLKEPTIAQPPSESRRYLEVIKDGLQFFYRHKTLRLIALDAVIVSAAAYYVIWLYQPLLLKLNLPIFYFGWFHMIVVGSEILVALNFVRLERLFGSAKSYLGFSALVTSLSFLMVAFFPSLITIVIFLVFAGGFGLTRLELMTTYMNKLIHSDKRATVLSSISMMRRFVLIFLNPLVGLLADKSLNWALVFAGLLPLLIFFFSPVEKSMLEG